jgi:hypothetical protein
MEIPRNSMSDKQFHDLRFTIYNLLLETDEDSHCQTQQYRRCRSRIARAGGDSTRFA